MSHADPWNCLTPTGLVDILPRDTLLIGNCVSCVMFPSPVVSSAVLSRHLAGAMLRLLFLGLLWAFAGRGNAMTVNEVLNASHKVSPQCRKGES